MNTKTSLTLALSFLFATAGLAGTWVDRYWPVNNGDYKMFTYGSGKQLTINTYAYGTYQAPYYYSVSFDSDDASGTEYHYKTETGIYLDSVKAGWVSVYLAPDVLLLDDALLQNGGKRVTSTTASQQGTQYPATFTVTIAKAGKVTVPAGTFPDCRNITVTEVAKVPGYGTVKATALTAVLAPNVGIIKKLVKNGVWASLASGTVGGVPISALVPPTHDTFTLRVEGEGTVTPDLAGDRLELGKSYKLTAKPAAGWLFKGWTGGYNSQASVLEFTMQQGLSLVAEFIENPYNPGSYSGLFSPESGVEFDKAGQITLAVTEKGQLLRQGEPGRQVLHHQRILQYGWHSQFIK